MIYRIELSDINNSDRFEVIQESTDKKAINRANDFCDNYEVVLLNIYEINSGYDILRLVY